MTMTPEQEETLEKLRAAVQDHLAAMGWLDDKLLSEFVVVSTSEMINEAEDGRRNFYTLTQSSVQMPFHHVVGLLKCALHWQFNDDDDGEEEP